MKKGFSYLEVLIAVSLLAIFFLLFVSWYSSFVRKMDRAENYYKDRNYLINKAEEALFSENTSVNGELHREVIVTNNSSMEYLTYQKN